MKCSKFPEREASGVCAYSGKPYCFDELVEVQGRMYAKDNLGHVMAEIKERNSNPMVFMNAGGGSSSSSAAAAISQGAVPTKSKGVAILLALLLGGFGAHKFYLGRPIWGVLYLIFCWTFIPALIAIFEAINYAFMSRYTFERRYG
jgi:TM2 domain-containing membrane protein YozV